MSTATSDINFHHLFTFDKESGDVNVIIETPKHSKNKYAYNEKLRLFKLKSMMPEGASFPYDFGFLPCTRGEDGDPLDILVLMEEPAFPGCLVECRLIGVIEAEQTEKDGKVNRNDRIVAVASRSILFKDIEKLKDLSDSLVEQIEHFFISYNQTEGKEFKVLDKGGPHRAKKLITAGQKKFYKEKEKEH
jgi:inorganic pyrophosphatase